MGKQAPTRRSARLPVIVHRERLGQPERRRCICLFAQPGAAREGVLAAGDVRHASVKRVASAVGEGSIAVQIVHNLVAAEPLQSDHPPSDAQPAHQSR